MRQTSKKNNMEIGERFFSESLTFTYLDPFNNFRSKEMSLEIRKDPVTAVTTRILPYRLRSYESPSIDRYLRLSPADKCPFCPPQRDKMTPRFPKEIVPEGQFKRGDVTLFPNAFPHSNHNTVAVLGNCHYLGMDEIAPSLMADGMLVCRDYMARMASLDASLQYASINWNYMPPAGGGLLHPHLQTVLADKPTMFMERLLNSATQYGRETGRDLWEDYFEWEKAQEERYVSGTGVLKWLVAFAPRGMAGEIAFYFPRRWSILALTDEELRIFCEELKTVFGYLTSINLASFNLAVYGTIQEEKLFPVQGRIIPRFLIQPLETSDVNYFEKLHGEIICPFVPEDMARRLKAFWKRGQAAFLGGWEK